MTDEENSIGNIDYFDGLGLSDHITITCDLARNLWQRHKYQTPKLDYNRADFAGIKRELNRSKLLGEIQNSRIEEAWELFQSTINTLVENHVPKKKPPKKKRNMYMTNAALQLRKKKERLWKRYLQTKRDTDYHNFAVVRNELRNTTRYLKKTFEKGLVKKIKEAPKAFWAYVNTKVKNQTEIETLTSVNGDIAETDVEKAEMLNNFFASVFTHEDFTDAPTLDVDWSGETLEDIVFTAHEVTEKLKELNPGKSVGPDNLHPALLKELASDISEIITCLFRKSMDEGKLPKVWKRGNVTPIFKKGKRQDPENYRPISLTSVLSKVMEKFVRDAIREHLMENDLLSQQQHGFIPGKSTSSQMLECFEEWSKLLEEGSSVDVLYLDFKKAFDAVPHKRLITKLYAYGIRGKVLKWVEAFLTGRFQRVVINGEASTWAEVSSGIPQGSVLGPLCFLVYINDLPGEVKSSIKLYADDAKLYGCADSQQHRSVIQKDLTAIQDWTRKWQLPLNLKKCKVLHLGHRNEEGQYTLEGSQIQKTESEKDLGIIVDRGMKFHEHSASTVKKANRILGLIKKSFDYLDNANMNLLYKAMIRPILEYGNVAWGPHYKMDQKKIERVQKRATRLVPSLRHLSYEERLEKLHLPTLSYRRKRGDMIVVYKIMTGRANGKQFFQVENARGRTRGHQFKLQKSHAKKDVRRYHFSQRVINDWNNLPSSVTDVKTVAAFKKEIDQLWASLRYQLS